MNEESAACQARKQQAVHDLARPCRKLTIIGSLGIGLIHNLPGDLLDRDPVTAGQSVVAAMDAGAVALFRLALLGPRCEQPIADLVIIERALCGKIAQAAPVDDVEPVFATGVQYRQADVDDAAQLTQHVEVKRRDARQAEHVDDARDAGGVQRLAACRRERVEEFGRRVSAACADIARCSEAGRVWHSVKHAPAASHQK